MIEAAVVDSSVAVKWLIEEPGSEQARLLSGTGLAAPELLLVECANVLWRKVKLGELSRDGARLRLAELSRAPIELHSSDLLVEDALSFAIELDHPVYDCVYLALAVQRDVPLVTADQRLVAAAQQHPDLAPHVVTLDELQHG